MDLDIPELNKFVHIIAVDFRTETSAYHSTEDTCLVKCYLGEDPASAGLRDLFCKGDLLQGYWRKTPFNFLVKEMSVTGRRPELLPSLIELSMVAFLRKRDLHPIMAYRRRKGLK